MATSAKQDKAARKYYKENKQYRKKKIARTQASQKADREGYNKQKREYYATHPEYKKYKREYAKKYRKLEPMKSKARKYRGKIK